MSPKPEAADSPAASTKHFHSSQLSVCRGVLQVPCLNRKARSPLCASEQSFPLHASVYLHSHSVGMFRYTMSFQVLEKRQDYINLFLLHRI